MKIRFQGKEYLLITEDIKKGGAIATNEQYENFTGSYAHLFRDGTILQHGEIIGSIEDIEFLDEQTAQQGEKSGYDIQADAGISSKEFVEGKA